MGYEEQLFFLCYSAIASQHKICDSFKEHSIKIKSIFSQLTILRFIPALLNSV